MPIKKVWVTEITQEYCESRVSNLAHHIQTVIDSKGGHTKYRKLEPLTRLDVIKFEIVLHYAFGDFLFLFIMSGFKRLHI